MVSYLNYLLGHEVSAHCTQHSWSRARRHSSEEDLDFSAKIGACLCAQLGSTSYY